MNSELLMIDLLPEKRVIQQTFQQGYRRLLGVIALLLTLSSFFFFGLGTVCYRYFLPSIRDSVNIERLTNLYHFAIGVGLLIGLLGLISILFIFIKMARLSSSFPNWLKKQSKKMLGLSIEQSNQHYFLVSNNANKNMVLDKKKCQLIATTLDGQSIMVGNEPILFGIYRPRLFLLNGEPKQTSNFVTTNPRNKLMVSALAICLVGGVIGSFSYLNRPIAYSESDSSEEIVEPIDPPLADNQGLISQTEATPTDKADSFHLQMVGNNNELFMTTNSGAQWQFVPIKGEWLRAGDYTLTTGTVPWGQWMEKTFELSPDFSWFLYSPDDVSASVEAPFRLYSLASTDNGVTWYQSKLAEFSLPIRYRKATFFDDGRGVVVVSTRSAMSSEGIHLYSTSDYGQTWQEMANTEISQPIQNASFVSHTTGFLATRNNLYYTHNSGRSFKDAIVSIPETYQANGLDLFQSPNEVSQVSANRFETKFNLVKADGIDIGKMFACLFESTDGGESWSFVKQLSQIELTD